MIIIRNSDEIAKIRKAARIVKSSLDEVERAVQPGISTLELSEIAEAAALRAGSKPAFKGLYGFPEALCTSVNEAVVHGIPRRDQKLKAGDIIGIDFGVSVEGYFADSARTVAVGFTPEGRVKELIDTTRTALDVAVKSIQIGGFIQDIGRAIEDYVGPKGFGIVREYVGHGIGTKPHEEPAIPHYLTKERGARLREGMVICIEPMVNMGTHRVRTLPDNWTVVTVDGALSAHFEHTIALLASGPEVLSA